MRAYKGVVENGVVVVLGTRLPEGTLVTVTVGEGELLRARITNVLKRPQKVKVRIKPNVGLAATGTDGAGLMGPNLTLNGAPPGADD
ncbi:hypothetical protein [Deinococcus humi]|uniref:Uncharacterized protein n=1 Tax=Deinococcus humi TaxID=662880 RepID=A0A7W8JRX7_9DEIO|nr:hypothetical protein [Deinococcus humi]MBB5361825.1 hypothetical protein [Deinococcus humi]GGO23466.1 hypothetical protein GCM10008949_11700 [Deinococcus humi]